MPGRIVPVPVFERWLIKEARKQEGRVVRTNTVSKYRAYALGNALSVWQRTTAGLTANDSDLTEKIYRDFYAMVKRGSVSNASRGTNEGYAIVLRMLDRVGMRF